MRKFKGDDSIEDGKSDNRCLLVGLGNRADATSERTFGYEHFVTRKMRSCHPTSLARMPVAIPPTRRSGAPQRTLTA